jgi:hypothetical protein
MKEDMFRKPSRDFSPEVISDGVVCIDTPSPKSSEYERKGKRIKWADQKEIENIKFFKITD